MESQQCLYPSIGIVWHSLIGVHTLAHIQKHAHSRFVGPPPPDLTACTPSFPVDSHHRNNCKSMSVVMPTLP